MDCIPDELWDTCYGGAPLWQHVYHTLHHLDQWFINPRDNDFCGAAGPHTAPAGAFDLPGGPSEQARYGRLFLHDQGEAVSIYLTSLHDEDLLQRPENCEWTRFTLILAQYRHLYMHMGMLMGFVQAETGLCPRTLQVGQDLPRPPYDPYE